MKAVVTLCFILAFIQVVVSKVGYGKRPIRQAIETADAGQLQQPPVAVQAPATPPDTVSPAQDLQQLASAIPSSNAQEQPPVTPVPSQIPSSAIISTTPNFVGQIPAPSQLQNPTTPCSPVTASSATTSNFIDPSSTPIQTPAPAYPYNPAMFPANPVAYPPSPYYANPMMNANPQQIMYNPYYMQNPMAYMNPQQMMYGMPPANSMPYMPFLPPLPSPPPAMNYSQISNNNLTYTPQQLQNTSPYPTPPNYIPAPNAPDQSTTPTVVSSTGEGGTDLNSLPPQVKEFIDMIPQILSMHESTPEQNTNGIKRPPPLRKFPKVPPSSLLKKKQYYQSNYAPSRFSNYPQRYGYYY